MLYIIREKKNRQLCYQAVIDSDTVPKAKDLYPEYNGRSMEMGSWDGDPAMLPDPFAIEAGKIRELTLDELIAQDKVQFSPELAAYLPQTGGADEQPGTETGALQLVQLAMDKDLLKQSSDCVLALDMLSTEVETRVAAKYPQAVELKRVKQCLDWVLAGQPKDDSRHANYQQMNDDIAAIKVQYKPLREAVKQHQQTLNGNG